VYYNH
jgi:hypothetical protein